jgi:general secretion pathway protein L
VRETLFIRLGATEQVTWLLDSDPVRVWEGTLAQAAIAAAGRQVIVLVPGTDVALSSVAVPTRNRGRMAAAVPYILEEQLAADVDDAHFALGERGADGRVAVAVVGRESMNAWLGRLADVGLRADQLIPESLLLPYQTGEWSVLAEARCVTVRSALQDAMALDAANAGFMLQRALAELEVKPAVLRVWLASGAAAVMIPHELGVGLISEALDVPPLSFLVRQVYDPAAINLLQGPYSRQERLGKMWRPWRPAAILLAAWVVLQFGINIYHYRELRAEDDKLRAEVDQIYLQTFPDAKRVVDARVQMEQRLAALRGGTSNVDDFMKLLAAVSGSTAALGSVEIDHITYKEGEVNIALMISDLQRLEQLKDRLAGETHMAVEIQSATTRNDQVEAHVQVKRGRS